jgi:hypothetical protein
MAFSYFLGVLCRSKEYCGLVEPGTKVIQGEWGQKETESREENETRFESVA